MTSSSQFCGLIAIVGAPNAGKSSLINVLVKNKVAIVSDKPHTTRQAVYGISCHENLQSIFIDTPGMVLTPQDSLQTYMRKTSRQSLKGADISVVVIDVDRAHHKANRLLLKESIKQGIPTLVALTKIDNWKDKSRLLPLIESYRDLESDIVGFFPISCHSHQGIEELELTIRKLLSPNSWIFPPNTVTQLSFDVTLSEITREKLFLSLHQEIPYKLNVVTEKWYWRKNKRNKQKELWIWQNIVVEKEGQKKLVLGQDGRRIRHVGLLSREEIQNQHQCIAHLFLHVTINATWMERCYG
ncbi:MULTISPECIES: GTPase Era [Holospora]|uniref:GTPase Era n=2 Tax=Holospora TaxID=44747 RepID=A0A061JHW0_9PROT|nr:MULTISPECIES: GTPase Era [Holospora]ETZ05013.1 GTPase Era [Holospora undulata HU1]GAJ45822.1 GTPase Era [Holospora elegans E1]